jgi:hypothetical protein
MSRAYPWYTIGLHWASRFVWVGSLVGVTAGCFAVPAEREDAHDASTRDIALEQVSVAVPTISDAGTRPPDTAPESDCAARFCAGHVARLAEYCDEPHARCPADIAEARANACKNRVADAALQFQSTCGGASIRMQYPYGAIDYHYDDAGVLTAVTTFVLHASEACETDVYLYGDPSCRAGAMEQVSCAP